MSYLYLALSVLMSASESVFGKLFNKRNANRQSTSALYNALLMLSVCLGWCALYLASPSFDAGVLWYSALFALCYLVCNLGIINALKYGSAAITALFINLSALLTTVWGILFWDTPVTPTVLLGLLLVIVSVTLCLHKKEKTNRTFSLRWLICVLLAFLGNAGCSIVQRTQQTAYGGAYGNMLMFFATGLSAIASLLIYLKGDRKDTKSILQGSWWIPICAGACNVILNLFVMLMALSELSPALIYPVIGVGGLAVVTVFSLLVFKEKMNPWQWGGIAAGTMAVLLLSF